jgi:hypothetical protein
MLDESDQIEEASAWSLRSEDRIVPEPLTVSVFLWLSASGLYKASNGRLTKDELEMIGSEEVVT